MFCQTGLPVINLITKKCCVTVRSVERIKQLSGFRKLIFQHVAVPGGLSARHVTLNCCRNFEFDPRLSCSILKVSEFELMQCIVMLD